MDLKMAEMENMGMENFNALGDVEEIVVEKEKKTRENEDKKEVMKEIFKQTIANNPEYDKIKGSRADWLYLVNTLGFGDTGSIIEDPATKGQKGENGEKKRKLDPTSSIIGYIVENRGKEPIQYTTEVFQKNENGEWVGSVVEKTAQPGEQFCIARKYMTILTSRTEFSFVLSNGKMIRSSRIVRNTDPEDAELEAWYFKFNGKQYVNSDEVKINIGKKVKTSEGNTKWIVLPDYEETFGFLNNEAVKRKRSMSKSYTTQDVGAVYIQALIKSKGL